MARPELRPSIPFKESRLSVVREACPPLEKVILPEENMSFRFINRYLAVKDLETALNLAKTLKKDRNDYYEEGKAERLLDIAAVQAEISENPIPAIKIATGLRIDSIDVLVRARASRIAAYAGDEKLAYELAEKATSKREAPWPFRYTANVLADRDRNPELFLNRAAELADTYQAGRKEFAGLRAANFADTARNMHKHERDPKPWLEKAEKTLGKAGKEESWAYNSLVNAYAAIGDYHTAKSLINNIVLDLPERTQDLKQRTLIQIAYKQAQNGDIDDAVKTAYESGFQNGIAIILMRKAYMQAKKGEDPSETLDRALIMVKQAKPDLWVERNIAIAYSTAGRILAIAGKNPDSMFRTSIQRTGKLQCPTDRSDAYKHIAMDMFASGKDSHLILDTVLLDESKSQNISMLSDILDAVTECGYYEYFNIIMNRLENYRRPNIANEEDEMRNNAIDSWKVIFLTKMAKTLGENSMTREEIARLSAGDIQIIRNSNSPKAEEALSYFGKI